MNEELQEKVRLCIRPLDDDKRKKLSTDDFFMILDEWISTCLAEKEVINISNWVFPQERAWYFSKSSSNIKLWPEGKEAIVDQLFLADGTQFNGGIDFTGISFEKEVSFFGAIFGNSSIDKPRLNRFLNCKFQNGCDFGSARFHQTVSFQDCTFNGKVDFQSAKLCNSILGFNWSSSSSDNKGLKGELNFKQLELIGNSVVSIWGLDFTENSRINIFHPEVKQHKRQFPPNKGGAERSPFEFSSVISTLKKPLFFLTHLKCNPENPCPIVTFNFCSLEDNNIKVKNSNREAIQIIETNYKAFEFDGKEWLKERAPYFVSLEVSSIYRLKNIKEEDFPRLEKEYAKEKIEAQKTGDQYLALEFHFWQLFYAGKQLTKPIPKIINFFYYHVCGYGLSITRPILFYLIVMMILWPIFYLMTIPYVIHSGDFCNLAMELSYNASSALGFESPMKILDSKNYSSRGVFFLELLYFSQKAIQLFLLFEFGAAIRNKVKR